MRMETLCPSETISIAFQTISCHNPEYHGENIHLRQKPQTRLHPSFLLVRRLFPVFISVDQTDSDIATHIN